MGSSIAGNKMNLALLVFLTKVPLYIYVVMRAWKFRHSLLIISANWLAGLAFFAVLSSPYIVANNKLVGGIINYGVVLSLFMVTYTAKELKRVKE